MASLVALEYIVNKAMLSPTFTQSVVRRIPMKMFDSDAELKHMVTDIRNYYSRSREPISKNALINEAEKRMDRAKPNEDGTPKFSEEERLSYVERVDKLFLINSKEENNQAFLTEVDQAIKSEIATDLILQNASKLKEGDTGEKLSKELQKVYLMNITGGVTTRVNFFRDIETKRELYRDLSANKIPTGIQELDILLEGGLARGEIGLISALTGYGKTMSMVNLMSNSIRMGYNCLYVALEELGGRILMRFEQALFGMKKSDFIPDGELSDDLFNQLQSLYKPHKDAGNLGELIVEYGSPQTLSLDGFENIIMEIENEYEKKFDVVFLDYPELLKNPYRTGNESEDGGLLYEGLKRVAKQRDIVMWGASQLGRGAYIADVKNGGHIEGSKRKLNAIELSLIVNQFIEEREAGFTRFLIDKGRNTTKSQNFIGMKVDPATAMIYSYRTPQEKEEHETILQERSFGTKQLTRAQQETRQKMQVDHTNDMINQFNEGMKPT